MLYQLLNESPVHEDYKCTTRDLTVNSERKLRPYRQTSNQHDKVTRLFRTGYGESPHGLEKRWKSKRPTEKDRTSA